MVEGRFLGLGNVRRSSGAEIEPALESPEWRPHAGEPDRLGCATTAPYTRVRAFVLATDGDPTKIDVWIVMGGDRTPAKVHGPHPLTCYLSTDDAVPPLPFGTVPKGMRFTVEVVNRVEGTASIQCGMICDEMPGSRFEARLGRGIRLPSGSHPSSVIEGREEHDP